MLYKNDFYKKYKRNVHSQNGEDGIIEELFKRLNIDTGWVCEFGAWDGIHLSNTFNLVKKGFNAVLIESDEKKYKDLINTAQKYPNITPINSMVGYLEEDTLLDNILQKTDIPKDFDLLSIDVDSCDYFIWDAFTQYNPKVVIIEINSSVDPYNEDWIYTPNHKSYKTTAFRPMYKLGLSKGYKFVLHTGNMVFVRNDLFDQLDICYVDPLENFRKF